MTVNVEPEANAPKKMIQEITVNLILTPSVGRIVIYLKPTMQAKTHSLSLRKIEDKRKTASKENFCEHVRKNCECSYPVLDQKLLYHADKPAVWIGSPYPGIQ